MLIKQCVSSALAELVVVVDDHLRFFPNLFSTTLWFYGVKLGVAQGEMAPSERRFAFCSCTYFP